MTPATDWLIDLQQQVAHPMHGDIVTMGRDPRSHVVVLDATVSRRHAELVRGAAGWMLHVAGTTGATVNDVRVDGPLAVAPGDVVVLGTRSYRLHRGDLPVTVVPAAPADPALQDPALLKTTASLPAVDLAQLRRSGEVSPGPSRRSPIVWAGAAALAAVVLVGTCGR